MLYIIINETTYEKINVLSFAPENDIVSAEVSIDELELDVYTDDAIEIGQYCDLYDALGNVWAHYWVTYAEKRAEGIVRVIAKSPLVLLTQDKLPAVMYSAESLVFAVADTLGDLDYTLDTSFSSATLTGFCPEQTRRERLQWICFVSGAYVRTCFATSIEILPLDNTERYVPLEETFWKPSVAYKDWVTALKATYYTFTAGTPTTTDEWVTDGTTTYIVTKQKFTLSNPSAPSGAFPNEIDIDGITLLTQDNVSTVLTYLSQLYFKRMDVDADILNDGRFKPGRRVGLYLDERSMVGGIIQSASFVFGARARSRLKIVAAEDKDVASLTIIYVWDENDMQIGIREYWLPVGYEYELENPYIDQVINGHRYIFRPVNETVSGEIVEGGSTETEEETVAIDAYDGIIHIISVDNVDDDGEGVVEIG